MIGVNKHTKQWHIAKKTAVHYSAQLYSY